MGNLLITIVVGVGIALVIGGSSLSLFQSARDGYDQQMLSVKMEQTVAALKSRVKIIDGLPALPLPDITGSYPKVPNWVTANAVDAQGHPFVYCPYSIRASLSTANGGVEGPQISIAGPAYSVTTYGGPLVDSVNSLTTSPAATLTPSSTSANASITLTAGSSVFTAADVGQTISSGTSNAVITAYTSGTVVTAYAGSPFPATTAIASGSWTLSQDTYVVGSPKPTLAGTTTAAPLGLMGYVIAFKPHDKYNATSAAAWCNEITVSSSGQMTTNDVVGGNVNGIVYPIVLAQSNYQQAAAKSDLVTLYVGTSASGDGTGRNPANLTTMDAALTQLAALRPFRAKLWLPSGTVTMANNLRTTRTTPAANLTLGAVTGSNVTVTAGSSIFSSANVGQEIASGIGRATITSYTSGTVVNAVVTQDFSGTSLSSGSWALVADSTLYDKVNLRGTQIDMEGAGSGSTTLSISDDFDLPVNVILRSMTVSPASSTYFIRVRPGMRWIAKNAALNNVTVTNGELWVDGTSSISASNATTALKITEGGRVVVNGTMTITAPNAGVDIQPGRLDVLPGASLTVTATSTAGTPIAPVIVRAGGKISDSGTMTITSNGSTTLHSAINIVPGGQVFMNNATLTLNTGTGSIAGDANNEPGGGTAPGVSGVIVDGGEMYMDDSGLLFPNGTATSVAAVDLVDGGKFYMHRASYIGSNGTASARPYYGVYDNGGSFVGGSSTGYSSGAAGEGGSAQSNIYAAAAGQCWGGNLLPSGGGNNQRHLFFDSLDGATTNSSAQSTNNSGIADCRHLKLSNQSNWLCTGPTATALTTTPCGALSSVTMSATSLVTSTNYNTSQTFTFTLSTYSGNVTVTGTPQMAFTIGGVTKYANYFSGSGTTSLVFQYTVAAGDSGAIAAPTSPLTLNGGTMTIGGNAATLAFTPESIPSGATANQASCTAGMVTMVPLTDGTLQWSAIHLAGTASQALNQGTAHTGTPTGYPNGDYISDSHSSSTPTTDTVYVSGGSTTVPSGCTVYQIITWAWGVTSGCHSPCSPTYTTSIGLGIAITGASQGTSTVCTGNIFSGTCTGAWYSETYTGSWSANTINASNGLAIILQNVNANTTNGSGFFYAATADVYYH